MLETIQDIALHSQMGFHTIKCEGLVYHFNQPLNCEIDYENNTWTMTNPFLDIAVWAENRLEAEQAFAFNFHALYVNFAQEKDSKLSPKARELKRKLLTLVQ
jgi:hypothetical protein